jgi:hypothetical protein
MIRRLTDDSGASFTSGNNARCVACDAVGEVHVVWSDDRDGNFEICHKVFDGMTWSGDERLSADGNLSWAPSMAAVPGGDVHVVWHDDGNRDTEVYYKYHDGVGWGPDERLTDAAGTSADPSAVADLVGEVHVVWHDYRDGNAEIYWKRSYGGAVIKPEVVSVEPDSGLTLSEVEITDQG